MKASSTVVLTIHMQTEPPEMCLTSASLIPHRLMSIVRCIQTVADSPVVVLDSLIDVDIDRILGVHPTTAAHS